MEGIESVDKILDTIDGSTFEEVMKERNRVCVFKNAGFDARHFDSI